MEIAEEWAQKITGNERRLFDDVKTELPYLPNGWIKNIRRISRYQ
jgi:hypothetical protein